MDIAGIVVVVVAIVAVAIVATQLRGGKYKKQKGGVNGSTPKDKKIVDKF